MTVDKHEHGGKWGLKPTAIGKTRNVFIRYPTIEKVLIYGSRAKGGYRPGSDIDLTILGGLTWSELQAIELALDELLLPYKFDLSLYSHIDNDSLKNHILRVGQFFYRRNAAPETGQ